jgi:hypothetical protein
MGSPEEFRFKAAGLFRGICSSKSWICTSQQEEGIGTRVRNAGMSLSKEIDFYSHFDPKAIQMKEIN